MITSSSDAPVEGECIGLDVGDVRIGVARINTHARIAEPLPVIQNSDPEAFKAVLAVVNTLDASAVVVGLPRGLDGQETAQTEKTRTFTENLKDKLKIPIFMIDEAGTTKEAESRQSAYPNASVDSLAAMVIVEDFIQSPNPKALQV